MNRNAITTFAELRTGDRFYFAGDKQKLAYQVTDGVSYNHVDERGKKTWMHDKLADKKKPVIFLRHTRPLPGEEWKLGDLQHKDIFYLPDDIIKEYQVIKYYDARSIVSLAPVKFVDNMPDATKVIFVRTEEPAKVI